MSTTAADFPNGTSPSADTSALPTPAANPLAASTSSAHAPPPPEIDVTFQRLSAYRNVRGVMVLARSAWSTATPAAGAVSAASGTSGIVQSSGTVFEGESGRRYAGALEAVVNATAGAVAACDEGVSVP